MTIQVSSKFAALSAALMINAAMIGATAVLFSGQLHGLPVTAVAQSVQTNAPPALC